MIQGKGIDLEGRLWVSPRCNVVMPWHPMLESIYEKAKGKTQTGTTKRGMGPTYADKVSYNGIRLHDFENKALLEEKIRVQLAIKNPIFEVFNMQPLTVEGILQEKMAQYEAVRTYIRESFSLLQDALSAGDNILLEGAQGALLDNIWGTYPFCTASVPLSGGASAGLGIPPHSITRVVGVAKAYTTRVGGGPFPTELFDQVSLTIQEQGNEFGTVTGRARRCGWFDAEIVRFTCQLNGVTELALTKLDVLDTLPVVKICIGYRSDDSGSQLRHYWEGDAHWLENVEPVYIELDGWQQSTREARAFDHLPENAQAYFRKVEELVGVHISVVSVGPDREETFFI
jgi:adenylosuccinate synthase